MSQQEALIDLAPGGLASPEALSTPKPATVRVKVWDLPLRIFHWSLLAAVATAIVTGKLGGEWMALHGKAGLAITGLVAFRIVWGLVGSSTARFSHFVPAPGQILSYLKGQWRGIGHNPLGALSVLALLAVLGVQAGTGLFSNDDIAFAGPLVSQVVEELSQKLTSWHHQLANVLFILLGLHVAAIAFYAKVKKDKLVGPMVTGWKEVPADVAQPHRARRIALILAVAAGVLAVYLASGSWIASPAPSQAAPENTASNTAHNAAGNSASTKAPAW